MEIREQAEFNDPAEFRSWLEENHLSRIEIWLIFHKRDSGYQTLTIGQAVEEALCYGWIQSRLKPLDALTFAVRFSPRREDSRWSLPNLKRARMLISQGRMTAYGHRMLPEDFQE
jgi:uncharacterized protein YdeI (YjbR/CyaY-like superfamily)